MKRNYFSLLAAGTILLLGSCSKYTDYKTQGNFVPSLTSNYRLLLNNGDLFEGSGQLPDIAADDVNIADSAQMAQLAASSTYLYYINTYTWQSPIFPTSADVDPDWNRLYNTVYNSNVVLNEVPVSNGGTDALKDQLMGEAKVHRAYAYLTLVNEYAKPYNISTAATDLGVPVLLKPDVSGNLTRASIAAVYNQITTDLLEAYPVLPRTSNYNLIPGQAAAAAMLARTYLYQANYTEAGRWADSALAIKNTLNDLSTLTTGTYPKRLNDLEIILSKIAFSSASFMPVAFRLSDTLLNVLGTADLRYSLFTTPASSFSATLYTGRFFNKERIGNFETRNVGPSVPEVMLIKAEALARSGNTSAALAVLNTLRQKRFTAATYTPLTAASAADALVLVLKERQRELFCRGLRWFDMRRLKNDAVFGGRTLVRNFRGKTFTLDANSNRYTFPIAEYVRSFSPGIAQNP